MEKGSLIIALAVKFKDVKSNPANNDFFSTWRITKIQDNSFF